jgi:amino acid transporter
MECTGVDSFGCLMSDMGGWTGNFLATFGNPGFAFLFMILMAGFVIIAFIAVKQVIGLGE